MSTIKFGTIDYLKNQWKDLFFRRKSNKDTLSRHRMREVAQKIVEKKSKQ